MAARRLTGVDAQSLWMSAAIPSDEFMVYAFDGPAGALGPALETVRDSARACPDLGVRVDDSGFWTYPQWAPRDVGADQFVVHEDLAGATWAEFCAALAAMAGDQLDARVRTWRLHVFADIRGIPGAAGPGTVAALQICHALADGVRGAALAGHLFGRRGDVPRAHDSTVRPRMFPVHALRAGAAHRRLTRDTRAGLVPPPAVLRTPLRTNARPEGPRGLRTVLCDRRSLSGPTVTVAVLSALSAALAGHLRALGDDPAQLGAEVPLARTGLRHSNNHFGNVGVGLYPDEEPERRTAAIAADLARRRRRAAHPVTSAESAASATIPAPLLRWGVRQFDPDVRSGTVLGNTVVSSVNRGPKDLHFGAAPVLLTTALPTLSPMMGLTHGVHGIGDTVTVSVHAAESAVADIDAYVDRLRAELGAGG
ncbi:hypothetical protein FHR72_004669 [Mycolicibacterium iranicum]|uniref:O-acyltransferase WSD1 C-terminal domain-containing protein n=1 Tax=Mycolicibacterium iranicum TaxID=912594 RepID=A0A839QIX8_MYCIR|nr:WS/DGAT domain-containing protein [Mycolicibacterium iranicum]MBB2993162.1 hypothetical protein [Mycolicibacterium iranicum]